MPEAVPFTAEVSFWDDCPVVLEVPESFDVPDTFPVETSDALPFSVSLEDPVDSLEDVPEAFSDVVPLETVLLFPVSDCTVWSFPFWVSLPDSVPEVWDFCWLSFVVSLLLVPSVIVVLLDLVFDVVSVVELEEPPEVVSDVPVESETVLSVPVVVVVSVPVLVVVVVPLVSLVPFVMVAFVRYVRSSISFSPFCGVSENALDPVTV